MRMFCIGHNMQWQILIPFYYILYNTEYYVEFIVIKMEYTGNILTGCFIHKKIVKYKDKCRILKLLLKLQTHTSTWDQTTQTWLNVLNYDGTFQSLWYNLCHEQTVQLLSGLAWCIRVTHHYLAVFPSQEGNLTVSKASLKNFMKALSNSRFTVILFLLSHVMTFTWPIK